MSQARPKKRVPIPLKTDNGPSWVAIIITGVFQLWPVTAILGFFKLRALWNKRRLNTYRNYMGVVGSRSSISLQRVAEAVGQSKADVTRVLSEMITKGYLGPEAYIDYSLDALILEPEADTQPRDNSTVNNGVHIEINMGDVKNMASDIANSIKSEFKSEYVGGSQPRHARTQTTGHPYAEPSESRRAEQTYEPRAEEPQPERKPSPVPEAEPEKSGHEDILEKLRVINEQILDEPVSRKIDRIAELTDDIYDFVEQNPARASDVRKFMNYYLPTTMKLLSSYGMLERQSYQGENIIAARKNIEDILDTLVHAFEKQLDQLFAADAVDISSDIQVLETMIAKDGLTQQAMQLKL